MVDLNVIDIDLNVLPSMQAQGVSWETITANHLLPCHELTKRHPAFALIALYDEFQRDHDSHVKTLFTCASEFTPLAPLHVRLKAFKHCKR